MISTTTEQRKELCRKKREVRFFHYWQVHEMKRVGLSIKQIAEELGIAEATVRNYLKPMNAKVE